ncbi:MAG: fibronectin type III domain-containing protein, partial [Bacteroidales bacterium]|nr:fibronectin type III domain-containing protein [Bacteroidales bacterium]
MKKHLFSILLLAAMFLPWSVGAQGYSCDFEDATENANWVTSEYVSTAVSHWYVGTATNNGGSNSLYISNDGGVSNAYTQSTGCTYAYAYRELTLNAGEYVFSFDWKCAGESSYDYIRAGLVPGDVALQTSYISSTATPSGWMMLDGGSKLNLNGTAWTTRQGTVTVPADGTYKLVFYWRNDNSGGSQPPAAIDNVLLNPNTCPAPTALAFSNVTTNSAVATWTAGGSETSWKVRLLTNGVVADSAVVSAATHSFSGLNANTPYTVEVVAICGADDNSLVLSGSFRTECAEMVLPYFNNFDDQLSGSSSATNQNFVFCWTRLRHNPGSSAYNYPYVSGTSGVNSSKCLYFAQGSTTSSYYSDAQVAVLPQVNTDVYTISGLRLSANYKRSAGSTMMVVGVMSDPNDYTTFVGIDTIVPTGTDWMLHTTYFNGYTGSGSYIAICQPRTGNSNTVYVDDVALEEVPSCLEPTALVVNGVTSSTATLSWTSNGTESAWELRYRVASDSVWTVESNVTTNPYTISGLNANTSYVFEVKAVCNASDNSMWSRPVSTLTECETFVLSAENPYYEGFENTAFPPICWKNFHVTGPGSNLWARVTDKKFAGNAAVKITDQSATTRTNLVTGLISVPQANAYQVRFYVYRESNYEGKLLEGIRVWASTSADTADGVVLGYIHRNYTLEPVETAAGWHEYSMMIPNAGDQFIIFEGINEYGNATFMDELYVEKVPTCFHPNQLAVTATATTATLTWTAGASETEWQIEYKQASDSAWTMVQEPVTDTTYILTNLNSSSSYDVRVRSYCTADDQSSWVSTSFLTECGIYALPWNDNFADGISRCWSKYSGLVDDVVAGSASLTSTTSGWSVITSNNGIQNKHVKVNVYGSSCKYWLVTPQIAIDGDAILSFDAALTDFNNADVIESFDNVADDRFVVLMTTDDGESWTILREWNSDSTNVDQYAYIPTTGANYSIEVDGLQNATVRFAFYGESTVTGGDNDLHLGNINVEALAAPAQSYVFDFEDAADNAQWTMTTADNSWFIGTAASNGGNNGLYISNDEGVTNAYTNSTSVNAAYAYRTITIADAEYSYSYNWRCSAETNWDFLRVALIPAEQDLDNSSTRFTSSLPSGWTALDGGSQRVGQSSWQTQEGTFRVPAGEYKLAFYWRNDDSGGSNPPAAIDNITISPLTCPAPLALAADSITAHTARLTWTAGGSESSWLVRVADADGVVDSAVVSAPVYNVAGLDAATTYQASVVALCSSDDNSLAVTTSFTTLCEVEQLPYFASYSNFNLCWNRYNGLLSGVLGGTANLTSTTSGWGTNTNVWNESHYKVNIYGGSVKYWMVTPAVNLSADAQLEFDAAVTEWNGTDAYSDIDNDDRFVVLATTDNGSTWTVLRSYGSEASDYATLGSISNTGSTIVIPLTQFTNQDVRIAFYTESTASGSDFDLHVHNIVVEEIPSCSRPTALAVDSTTTTSASFSWTAGASESAWELQYRVAGDSAWTLVSGITATNYTLTGLQSATAYEAQVRAACSATDFSVWTASVAFGTEICAPEDQCAIYVTMYDEYDDSWNGASLRLVDSITGMTVHTFALASGDDGTTATANVCSGRTYQLVWASGSYDSECSFTVADANGGIIYNGLQLSAGVLTSFVGCGTFEEPTIDTVAMTMAYLAYENYFGGTSIYMADSTETNVFAFEFGSVVVSDTIYTIDDMDMAGYINYNTYAQVAATEATLQMIVRGADTTVNATML